MNWLNCTPTCLVAKLVLYRRSWVLVVAVDEKGGSGHLTLETFREKSSSALASLDELVLWS